jgi:hypothetical protein
LLLLGSGGQCKGVGNKGRNTIGALVGPGLGLLGCFREGLFGCSGFAVFRRSLSHKQ